MKRLIDALPNAEDRAHLERVLAILDSTERENVHLRLIHQKGGCPYGHASETGGCALGYPGCACMDDLMAMAAWCPEDEDKAAVRIGRRLAATELRLRVCQLALIDAATVLDGHGAGPRVAEAFRQIAATRVEVAE